MESYQSPGQHTWAVGYDDVMYYSVTSDADELDLITWHLGSDIVQLKVIDSKCIAEDSNKMFNVTCGFDEMTSQLTSSFKVNNELTSEDDQKVVKFEAEGRIDNDGTKDKASKEVVITVKGILKIKTAKIMMKQC